MSHAPLDLAELELNDLEATLEADGVERFHARQVYRWIHRRAVTEFERMTDLPLGLRTHLQSRYSISTPRIVHDDVSTDGTRKLVLELADGKRIESV